MMKVTHSCGYSKEVQFLCPQCGMPFCDDDTQQSTGGILLGSIITNSTASEVKSIIDAFQIQLNKHKDKINEIIKWCNVHKKPHEGDIIIL